jgi:hypothetical protein
MGWRFRYRVPLGKFARVNLGARGITFSIGRSPFTVNIGKRVRHTSSIPGTGLSYVSEGGQEPISYRETGTTIWRALKAIILLVIGASILLWFIGKLPVSTTTNYPQQPPASIEAVDRAPSTTVETRGLESAPLPPRRPNL